MLATFLPISGGPGEQAAIALRDALLPFAYLLALAGFFWQISRNGENWQAHFETIILTALLVLAIGNWPGITETLGSVSKSVTEVGRAKMENGQQARLLTVLASAVIAPPQGSFLGNFDPWAMVDAFAYQGVQVVQRIAVIAQMFLNWIQQFALNGLLAISPLLLGFIMLPWTRQIATHFIFATISVALWDVGFALADVIVFQVQNALLDFLRSSGALVPSPAEMAAKAAIVTSTGTVSLFFAAYGAIVVFNILLYFASPLLVGYMLRGANPMAGATNMLQQVAQASKMAMSTANAAMGSARAAEAIGAQIQAAQATSQAGTAHAQAMSAFQQSLGSGSSAIPMPFSSSGDGGGVPAPPGQMQFASSGSSSSVAQAGGEAPAMSAAQIDPGHFQLTDSNGGTSTHAGNASDPQDRNAAFFIHQQQPQNNQPPIMPMEDTKL